MPFANISLGGERLAAVLDRLGVEEGAVVFLHTSYSRSLEFAESPQKLIDGLLLRLGPAGTLAMPRYAWHLDSTVRPWKGYADYLLRLPTMNLNSTPANIGIVPETFRGMEGVECSISHFWPLSARGRFAAEILQGQEGITHAFGPDSSFARLLKMDAKVLGLGVTLNTSSLAPVTDWCLGVERPHDIFTSSPITGLVVGRDGREYRPSVTTMRAESVRDIKPSRILQGSLRPGVDFPFVEQNGNFFFCYRSSLYHEAAMHEGLAALDRGGHVPWMAQPAVEE